MTMLLPDKNLWRAGRETHPSLEAPSDARAAWLCDAAPFCIWLSIVVCNLFPKIFREYSSRVYVNGWSCFWKKQASNASRQAPRQDRMADTL